MAPAASWLFLLTALFPPEEGGLNLGRLRKVYGAVRTAEQPLREARVAQLVRVLELLETSDSKPAVRAAEELRALEVEEGQADDLGLSLAARAEIRLTTGRTSFEVRLQEGGDEFVTEWRYETPQGWRLEYTVQSKEGGIIESLTGTDALSKDRFRHFQMRLGSSEALEALKTLLAPLLTELEHELKPLIDLPVAFAEELDASLAHLPEDLAAKRQETRAALVEVAQPASSIRFSPGFFATSGPRESRYAHLDHLRCWLGEPDGHPYCQLVFKDVVFSIQDYGGFYRKLCWEDGTCLFDSVTADEGRRVRLRRPTSDGRNESEDLLVERPDQ
ncbi:MAG: hypothetical protein AAGD10_12730 [Myxococcota bacterium]